MRGVEPGCERVGEVVVFAEEGGGGVAVGDEVGAVGADGEFEDVLDGRGGCEEGFEVRGEVVPGEVLMVWFWEG